MPTTPAMVTVRGIRRPRTDVPKGGTAHTASGRPTDARDVWQRAADILQSLGHPDADDIRAKLHALAR